MTGVNRLDGNAAAGLLSQIFALEITHARVICASCGAEGAVGELIAYGLEMGVILRCPGCEAAIIRIGQHRAGAWLDLQGATILRASVPENDERTSAPEGS